MSICAFLDLSMIFLILSNCWLGDFCFVNVVQQALAEIKIRKRTQTRQLMLVRSRQSQQRCPRVAKITIADAHFVHVDGMPISHNVAVIALDALYHRCNLGGFVTQDIESEIEKRRILRKSLTKCCINGVAPIPSSCLNEKLLRLAFLRRASANAMQDAPSKPTESDKVRRLMFQRNNPAKAMLLIKITLPYSIVRPPQWQPGPSFQIP